MMIDEPPVADEAPQRTTRARPRTRSAEAALPRWKRRVRVLLAGTVALVLLAAPWWGPAALATFDFFHLKRVEFDGVRYTDPDELLPLLRVDTLMSVWMPLDSLAARVTSHPMVASATVRRRLPGTVHITVTERTPVALVPGNGRLVPVDAQGDELPIDPVRAPVDVPVVSTADSSLLRVLDRIRAEAPTLWGRLSQAGRDGPHNLRLTLGRVTVRTRDDVTVARLGDILPVEADLARRRLRPLELDLRFRDQVIARLP